MTAAQIVTLMIALLRPTYRTCIEARRDRIAEQAVEAVEQVARERPGDPRVPVDLLLVIGYLEAHWGCAPRSGGCWGAPVSPLHRSTAGRPVHAARALASGFRVCGTELGAVSRFRCGLCRCPPAPERGYSPRDALRLLDRVRAQTTDGETDASPAPAP